MLQVFDGRINRRTFIIGNLLAFGIFLFITGLIMVPLAILSLAIQADKAVAVIDLLNFAVIFPAILYYFYFCVLMVKRSHDLGWPGLMMIITFTLALILARLLDIYPLNFLAVMLLLFFALKPGKKARNAFGPAPRKNFKLDYLKLNF